MATNKHLAELSDSPNFRIGLTKALAALRLGEPREVVAQYDPALRTTCVKVVVNITDEVLFDGTFGEMEEAFMQELQDEDTPKTVERPSGLQINVGGANNLQVKWDRVNGCFRLTSTCVVCGRTFERTMRGFVTKDLITLAHDLGYTLGEHAERHRSFSDHLRELRRQDEKEQETHKT